MVYFAFLLLLTLLLNSRCLWSYSLLFIGRLFTLFSHWSTYLLLSLSFSLSFYGFPYFHRVLRLLRSCQIRFAVAVIRVGSLTVGYIFRPSVWSSCSWLLIAYLTWLWFLYCGFDLIRAFLLASGILTVISLFLAPRFCHLFFMDFLTYIPLLMALWSSWLYLIIGALSCGPWLLLFLVFACSTSCFGPFRCCSGGRMFGPSCRHPHVLFMPQSIAPTVFLLIDCLLVLRLICDWHFDLMWLFIDIRLALIPFSLIPLVLWLFSLPFALASVFLFLVTQLLYLFIIHALLFHSLIPWSLSSFILLIPYALSFSFVFWWLVLIVGTHSFALFSSILVWSILSLVPIFYFHGHLF